MLRAQTRGNPEIHKIFIKKIAVVDLRAGGLDASEASRQWEAAAGISARSQATGLKCNMLIAERPCQHKATS
jgi:hypothetical protein